MDPHEYYFYKKAIDSIEDRLNKINKQIIQAKYYRSEKGRIKLSRQNEKRRMRTKFKKVLKELLRENNVK